MKLLIVEDDMDLREGLSFSFSGDGYEVTETGTKKEGLKAIAKGGCDLVLLDCNLPDGTGFELCREVRSYSNVPIIMLTARDTEMDEIKALELGVNDYLSKPFSLGVLKARMKRILQDFLGDRRGADSFSEIIHIFKRTIFAALFHNRVRRALTDPLQSAEA